MTADRDADEAVAGAPVLRPRPAHLTRSALVIPAVLLVLGVLMVIGILTMDVVGDGGVFGPTAMPWAVAVLCFVIGAALTADILRPRPGYEPALGPRPRPGTDLPPDEDAAAAEDVDGRAVATAVGGVVVFIVLLSWLGWILSATLLFTAVAVALGNRRYLTIVLSGLALASVIQIVFSGLLGISLPAGFVGGF